jgi:phosphatidylglycerophosphatase A
MFLVPFSLRFLLLGFILFRVIDITKPFKIGKIEKVSGGWGIMGDDIAAGVLANLIIQALRTMLAW